MQSAEPTLRIGDLLDSQFALLRGEPETSKVRSVTALARVFQAERVPYVVMDGLALQFWSSDPRTTLDVDVAVLSYDALPRAAEDPARRRSKRLMDLADACALAEQHPDALTELRPDERKRLDA